MLGRFRESVGATE